MARLGKAGPGTARLGQARPGEANLKLNMFKPKNKEAYWKMIYDQIEKSDINTIFNFDDLSTIIGVDIEKNRSAVYRASKELSKKKKRMLIPERGIGYKLVEGMDMFDHAEGRHTKAGKQIKLANFEASNVNLVILTDEEKSTLQNFLVQNRRISEALNQQVDRAGMQSILTVQEMLRLKEMLRT